MDKKTQAAYNNGFTAGMISTLTYVMINMDPPPTPEQLKWLEADREATIEKES